MSLFDKLNNKRYNLQEKPSDDVVNPEFKDPEKVILSPLDYPFIKPKLLVQKDDAVKVGTPLFFDKLNPDVKFVSSLSGKISDIVYGERRSIQSIIITNDCKYEQIDLSNKPTINSNKDSWIDFLKASLIITFKILLFIVTLTFL